MLSAPHTKLPKTHTFPHQALPLLGPLKVEPPQQSAANRKLLPTFLSPFTPMVALPRHWVPVAWMRSSVVQKVKVQYVLTRLNFCLCRLSWPLSRSQSPGKTWEDQAPVSSSRSQVWAWNQVPPLSTQEPPKWERRTWLCQLVCAGLVAYSPLEALLPAGRSDEATKFEHWNGNGGKNPMTSHKWKEKYLQTTYLIKDLYSNYTKNSRTNNPIKNG